MGISDDSNSRWSTQNHKIDTFKDRPIDATKMNHTEKKIMIKTKQRVRHAGQDQSQHSVVRVLKKSERRGRGRGEKFEEIITEYFINLMKNIFHRFRKISPNRMNNFENSNWRTSLSGYI